VKSSDAKASKCQLKFCSRMTIFIKLVYLSSADKCFHMISSRQINSNCTLNCSRNIRCCCFLSLMFRERLFFKFSGTISFVGHEEITFRKKKTCPEILVDQKTSPHKQTKTQKQPRLYSSIWGKKAKAGQICHHF